MDGVVWKSETITSDGTCHHAQSSNDNQQIKQRNASVRRERAWLELKTCALCKLELESVTSLKEPTPENHGCKHWFYKSGVQYGDESLLSNHNSKSAFLFTHKNYLQIQKFSWHKSLEMLEDILCKNEQARMEIMDRESKKFEEDLINQESSRKEFTKNRYWMNREINRGFKPNQAYGRMSYFKRHGASKDQQSSKPVS